MIVQAPLNLPWYTLKTEKRYNISNKTEKGRSSGAFVLLLGVSFELFCARGDGVRDASYLHLARPHREREGGEGRGGILAKFPTRSSVIPFPTMQKRRLRTQGKGNGFSMPFGQDGTPFLGVLQVTTDVVRVNHTYE